MIEQAKFTYSPLGKALEKQTKTIEDQSEKKTKVIKIGVKGQILDTYLKSSTDLFSKKKLSEKAMCELTKLKR